MAADNAGEGEKGRTAADDFPEFPRLPVAMKQAAVDFYGKWQEFTMKRGSTVRSSRTHRNAERGHGIFKFHIVFEYFWQDCMYLLSLEIIFLF